MDENKILVTLNPIGYKIELNEINRILDLNDKIYEVQRANVSNFFAIKPEFLTKELLEKYVEACQAMTNISVGSFNNEISSKLIGTLSSAKRCFSYREFLACIELCALHGEMLANFLCIINKESLQQPAILDKLESNVKKSVKKHLKFDDFYDRLNHTHRLVWLETGDVIKNIEKSCFSEIHDTRIKYFHHWNQSLKEKEQDALNGLKNISSMSAKFLELFANQVNIQKIKEYMEIINHKKSLSSNFQ